MTNYELIFVLPGTMTDEEAAPLSGKVETILKENGAEDLTLTDMGKNRLAYPMRHIRYGFFKLCQFQAAPEKIKGMRDKLGLMPEILRLFIKTRNLELEKKAKSRPVRVAPVEAIEEREAVRVEPVKAVEVKAVAEKEKVKEKEKAGKVSLEEIDKRLDEILGGDISDV